MKKILALALALICIIALVGAVCTTTNIRVIQGEVSDRIYIEDGDYMNTEFVTTDGESWIAEDYTAPLGDKVLIVYDKCDSSTIYDDEIIYIVHFTAF